MSSVRKAKAFGATLMSKMFPHPQCHSSKLRRLGYVPPTWHRAFRRAPPKDIYPLRKLTKTTELPGDKTVRRVFLKIPMLRKEKYEHYNVEYQPLATRIALTQMRLMREDGMDEDSAFKKCENEIFKEELYYFAKGIRDNKGNHFKLTSDELRHFYIHDLINEATFLKSKIQKAVDEHLGGAEKQAKPETTQKLATQVLSEYFATDELNMEEAQQQAKYEPYIVDVALKPYKKTGVWDERNPTLFGHSDYNPDDVLLARHGYSHHETQRYKLSQVQVPASAFIEALDFADEPRVIPDYKRPMSFDDDSMFHEGTLTTPGGTHFYGLDAKNFFGATEGLTYRALNNAEAEIDFEISKMLLEQDEIAKQEKDTKQ